MSLAKRFMAKSQGRRSRFLNYRGASRKGRKDDALSRDERNARKVNGMFLSSVSAYSQDENSMDRARDAEKVLFRMSRGGRGRRSGSRGGISQAENVPGVRSGELKNRGRFNGGADSADRGDANASGDRQG